MSLVVGPIRSPIDFEIENVHNWLTSGPDRKENLDARFSFAICDAADAFVLKDLRMDGLIGFGPDSYVVARISFQRIDLSLYTSNMPAFTPPFRHEQDYGNRDYPVRLSTSRLIPSAR